MPCDTIGLIVGSPKAAQSCSAALADTLAPLLEDAEVLRFSAHAGMDAGALAREILPCGRLVFLFPLYIDAVPSHLLRLLLCLEEAYRAAGKTADVFAVVNCGFFETRQNRFALEIIGRFCARAGLRWRGGLGVGMGGFLSASREIPMQSKLKAPVFAALRTLAGRISHPDRVQKAEPLFATLNMPRFLYRFAGNLMWKQQARRNGLGRSALRARPAPPRPQARE